MRLKAFVDGRSTETYLNVLVLPKLQTDTVNIVDENTEIDPAQLL
jgi:hypothetical protein